MSSSFVVVVIFCLAVCREEGKWSSQGLARTGYSFWLTVIATVCYFANTVIIALATRDPHARAKVSKRFGTKEHGIDKEDLAGRDAFFTEALEMSLAVAPSCTQLLSSISLKGL